MSSSAANHQSPEQNAPSTAAPLNLAPQPNPKQEALRLKLLQAVGLDQSGKLRWLNLPPKARRQWAKEALRLPEGDELRDIAVEILKSSRHGQYAPVAKDDVRKRRKAERAARKANRRR